MTERGDPAGSELQEDIDPHSFEWFASLGLHLEPVKRLLKRIKFDKPDQIFVDLGAATGWSTKTLIDVIPSGVLPKDRIIVVEPSNEINVARQRLGAHKFIEFIQQDESQFLADDDRGEVDQIHFHNAVHLLSTDEKLQHFRLALKRLKRGGLYAAVTTFIEGGEADEELFYKRWVMQSLRELRAKSKDLYDKVSAALRETTAEARRRLSGIEYGRLLENAGFNVLCCDDRSSEAKMPITYKGFQKIAKYWLWNNGVLPGVPYDIAEEVQTIALARVWQQLERPADYVSLRNCALLLAQKPA